MHANRGSVFQWLSFVQAALLCVATSHTGWSQQSVSEEEKRANLLLEYVAFQRPVDGGLNPPVPLEYGPQLIPDLIQVLNGKRKFAFLETTTDPTSVRRNAFEGLLRATKTFDGSEEAKLGRATVYELMDDWDLELRRRAMSGAAYLDEPGATDAWLKKLSDPDLSIRVDAASLLGANAPAEAAREIERVIEQRTRGLTPKEIAKDESLEWMRAAIAEIQDRANGTPGPSVSDRMNEADLIARGGPTAKVPESSSPPKPAPIAATPAPAINSPQLPTTAPVGPEQTPVAAPAASSETQPLWMLVTGAALAVAALAGLLFFRKRGL